MSLESLQQRLAALHETTAQLRALIARLADMPFAPGALPAAVDEEGSPSSELAGEISALMRAGLEEQQVLLEEARFVRPEGEGKRRLGEAIAAAGEDISRCRSALRRARLRAKQNLERAQRTERELVIRSFAQPADPPPTNTGANTDANQYANTEANAEAGQHASAEFETHGAAPARDRDKPHAGLSDKDRHTVHASSSLTAALRRTHALMTAELTRSEFAHQMLAESSAALAALDASYASLDGMLSSSRALLSALLRAQKSDTWYLRTARAVLLGTLAWLVFRRLLYGPLWWLVYLPLRVVFGVTWGAGRAVLDVGRRGGGSDQGKGWVRDGRAGDVEGLPGEDLPTVRVGEGEDGETVVVVMDGEANVIREEGAPEMNMTKEGGDEVAAGEGSHPRDEL
ncbi:hypothetical protein ESCO_004879 [Escovopsis weberi]|uniref:Sec20 C-terminal domain-containing protein n=1 Tax=Escovopsis weberi TaxID=150374 RepID=A0A0M8MZJ5_ESCWE|nr:hypothetical protein ESCO_004879 [Escovopsis weberi]